MGVMELRAGTGTCLPFSPPPQRGGGTQKHDVGPKAYKQVATPGLRTQPSQSPSPVFFP